MKNLFVIAVSISILAASTAQASSPSDSGGPKRQFVAKPTCLTASARGYRLRQVGAA